MAFIVTRTLSSSSTIRSLPLANAPPRGVALCLGRAADRQRDGEGRAATGAAAHPHVAAVRLDDPERDPEAEPGALPLLRRVERLEDVRQVLLGDARAGVADLD